MPKVSELVSSNIGNQIINFNTWGGLTFNVKAYGAKGDGSDDTASFIKANAAGLNMLIPPGTYKIQNFVPRAGTIIHAYGATISRLNSTTYSTTGSSAAVIITNTDVEIHGGTWDELTGVIDTYSGSICIENGTFKMYDAIIQNSWGGIFGHALQNGVKEAEYVLFQNCEFRYCFHNTWLADIKNLAVLDCYSHHSNRDGLKLYRKVRNFIVDGGHYYNNGDGTAGQSRDGMDLFIAGNQGIISNVFIYGNAVKGIDIKRTLDGDAETILDEKYIISNAHIFSNGDSGIEFECPDATRGYINNVTITACHIYSNALYGIKTSFADIFNFSLNQLYGNGYAGIRIDNAAIGGIVSTNTVYGNGVNHASTRAGINIQSTALNVDVYHNKVYTGGSDQTTGISYGSTGVCKDNNVSGHATDISSGSAIARGTIKEKHLTGALTAGICFVCESPMSLAGLSFMANGTGTFNIQISKRKADGTFSILLYNADVVVSAGYVKNVLDISGLSASNRLFVTGQTCFVTAAFTSGTFTSGMLEFSLIN